MPEGTIVNPTFPAPLSFNITGAVDLCTGAGLIVMSEMLLASEELRADAFAGTGMGIQANVWYGLDKSGEFFVTFNMESIASGMGALTYQDGEEACTYHWTAKSSVANVESMEELFPLMYLFRKEVTDTGGPGKFRGGVANAIGIIPWDTDSVMVRPIGVGQEPRNTLGLAGGYPSNNSSNLIIKNSDILNGFKRGEFFQNVGEIGGQPELIPCFHEFSMSSGDVLIQYQTGGGGFGDPIERDPKLVIRDVKSGYVSLEAAKEIYGVLIDPETLTVNPARTDQQRQAIISGRLKAGRK
jgi:N-methylhydantoinase B